MAEKKPERPKKEEQQMSPGEKSYEETPRTEIKAAMGEAGATVKEGVLSSLKGINEIETQIATLVRNTVSDTLKATGSVADETLNVAKEVLQGTFKAVEEVGTGLLLSSKSVAKGLIMGVSDVGGDVLSVAKLVIKGTVKGAGEIGADVGQVARRTVDGIIEAGRETGANVEEMAKVTVNGAIEAAGSIGNTAVKAVSDVLVTAVEGVKDIASTAFADIAFSLRQVFSTPPESQRAETAGIGVEFTQPAARATREGPPEAKPALTPQNSIQDDKVICLECGAEMRQLTSKHLVGHGMDQKQYKKKYGFSMRTPLAAKSVTKAQSSAAKKRGLPENLKKAIEARRQTKAKVAAKPSASVAETGKKVKRRASRKKTT
jgi:predicted transcriptional regulator